MQNACPTSKIGHDEMRHLTPAFALGALHRGKQIEQFLGGIERDGRRGLRWIAVSPGRAGVSVYLSEVEDIGTDTFRDVTEFPPLDPEDEDWGKEIGTLASPEEALRLAERELGADPAHWVNQGIVCDEYHDFQAANGIGRPANP
ncbi:hypothetical protein [Streptomyces sp. IB201691-2A2]|uniref:hypothetical protein n=1 Tax=Streptomyces sp. IB201691-2A2 TaxID=2561920 RepID=UPI00117D9F3E|nr:hypothetical protein [Streptomyces sp. IB201691-2A2]TRO58161.1 hypothetical protein E4K73_40110 [Streptomyces sp. IB201691-2A2]